MTMKNALIGILLVACLVLSSIIYKKDHQPVFGHFPQPPARLAADNVNLFIYVFFSKTNCPPCLNVMELLNQCPDGMKVIGVVPQKELNDEPSIRKSTGITFELTGHEDYKDYIPPYAPSIVGVSRKGKIYFVLPLLEEIRPLLIEYLTALYAKTYPRLTR